MKKQKQKEIKTTQLKDLVVNHKLYEVGPPPEANKGMDGKYGIDKAKAAQFWFKAAKGDDMSKGFLDVPSETLDPKQAQNRDLLYKKK
jgi:hypothetical protein